MLSANTEPWRSRSIICKVRDGTDFVNALTVLTGLSKYWGEGLGVCCGPDHNGTTKLRKKGGVLSVGAEPDGRGTIEVVEALMVSRHVLTKDRRKI